MAAVIPYAFCALAGGLVARVSGGKRVRQSRRVHRIRVFHVHALWLRREPVLYGLVLLLLGIPVFVWQRDGAPMPRRICATPDLKTTLTKTCGSRW